MDEQWEAEIRAYHEANTPDAIKRAAEAQRDQDIRELEQQIQRLKAWDWYDYANGPGVRVGEVNYVCGVRLGKPSRWREETRHCERYVNPEDLPREGEAGR